MALSAQVVDFIRFKIEDQICQTLAVRQVSIMQEQTSAALMRILVDVIDTARRERARSTNKAVNRVALFEQQFGKIRAILASDSGDESSFGHEKFGS